MADNNDDLLEDGDLGEANFVLDLAEEEALLADVDDDIYRGIEGNLLDDDDYLEMGVDDDLILSDDENQADGNSKRRTIKIERTDDDDSDGNSGRERARFKSERLLTTTASTRNTAAIPDTLDAVAVRNPIIITTNKGGGGNRGGGKAGWGGGQNWKGNKNHPNIHVNPHFRPRFPMGGPPHMWNGGFPPRPPLPPFLQPPHHQPFGGFQPMQPPHWNNMPPLGPPPHFPPQPAMDTNFYGPPDPYYQNQPNYHQPFPPHPQMGWGNNFYQGGPVNYQSQPPPPPPFQPGGMGPPMGPPRMRPPFNPPPPRPPFNPNQNKQFPAKTTTANQVISPHKRLGLQIKTAAEPPAKQRKFKVPASKVNSNLQEVEIFHMIPGESLPVTPKIEPQPQPVIEIIEEEEEDEEMKAYRLKIEEQKKLRERILREKEEKRLVAAQQKLQESVGAQVVNVKTTAPINTKTVPVNVKTVPVNIKTPVSVNVKTSVPVNSKPSVLANAKTVNMKSSVPVHVKPSVPVNNKKPVLVNVKTSGGVNKKIPVPVNAKPPGQVIYKTVPVSVNTMPNSNLNKKKFKMAKVRLADGKTIVKKVTLVEIKLKQATPRLVPVKASLPGGPPTCVVSVENLSASTTQKQLETMAGDIGPVEKVELDSEKKTAIIKFVRLESSKNFVNKYQKKMVDLSMISLKFVQPS